ncbi:MAG: acyltransferase family protein [Gammaproteobacteria bacterium]|nr:acyltransferase family protein [Gammaproteobacteria bacterium]
MKNTDGRFFWVDCLRVGAIFGVIVIHIVCQCLYVYTENMRNIWWSGHLMNSFAQVSVPIFFMVSGYLALLDHESDVFSDIPRKLKKIIVPLIGWSLMYIVFSGYLGNEKPLSIIGFFSIAWTPSYFHLWFIYFLIGLYLVTPFLRVLVRFSDDKVVIYFLVLWFLFSSIGMLVKHYFNVSVMGVPGMVIGYVGYYMLGHLLGSKKIELRNPQAVFLLVVGYLITVIGTAVESMPSRQLVPAYYDNFSPGIVFMAIGMFVLAILIKNVENKKITRFVNSAAQCSFGIYFIHLFLVMIVDGYTAGMEHSFSGHFAVFVFLCRAVGVFLLSWFFIYILRLSYLKSLLAP